MTVKIALPPDEEKKLSERAAACGQPVMEYVHQLIKRDIAQPSFAELFAPVQKAVRDSGISEPALDSLIQEAVSESRNSRRAKKLLKSNASTRGF